MRAGSIEIDGKIYPYQIVKSQNKTIRVNFVNGTFIIKCNERYYDNLDLAETVRSNSRSFVRLLNHKQMDYHYEDHEQIRVLEKEYQIVASLSSAIYGDKIFVNMKKEIKKEFFHVISPLLLSYLKERTEYFHQKYFHHIPIPDVKIQLMTSRFGVYHTRNHYITFSSYLAHYPLDLIDYVIVHELSHTIVLAHDTQFYQVLASVLPHYQELERRLKEERYIPCK